MKTASAPPLAGASAEPFTAVAGHVRAVRVHRFAVALPPESAFGLFEPVGEKKWAEDWNPVFATDEDARLHAGSVFTVERPHPGGRAPQKSVWTVTAYEPCHLIEYHNVIIGNRATRITVLLEPAGARQTHVTVRYVYTGLSESGDRAIAKIDDVTFRDLIDGWDKAIAAYLQRGTPATP